MNSSSPPERSEIKGIFEGPIVPVTLRLAFPLLVGMFFQILYSLVDTFFVTLIDRSNTAIFSGMSLVMPLFFFAMSLAQGISVGVSSLIARAIGERNQDVINRTADSGLLLAVIVGVVTLVVGYFFADPLLGLLGAKGEVYQYAHSYYIWLLPAIGTLFIGSPFGGVLQGEGLTRYIMVSMLISTGLNIILDPLFIFLFW